MPFSPFCVTTVLRHESLSSSFTFFVERDRLLDGLFFDLYPDDRHLDTAFGKRVAPGFTISSSSSDDIALIERLSHRRAPAYRSVRSPPSTRTIIVCARAIWIRIPEKSSVSSLGKTLSPSVRDNFSADQKFPHGFLGNILERKSRPPSVSTIDFFSLLFHASVSAFPKTTYAARTKKQKHDKKRKGPGPSSSPRVPSPF